MDVARERIFICEILTLLTISVHYGFIVNNDIRGVAMSQFGFVKGAGRLILIV